MPIDPYTQAKLKFFIEVNSLKIPALSAPENLLRFVRPLAFYNEGQAYELSFSGTSLRVRVENRNLLLCSRHQLTNARRKPEEIVTILEGERGERIAISPDAVSQAILDPKCDPEYADTADILLAEFAPGSAERNLDPHFLQMDLLTVPDLDMVPRNSIDAIFTLGFPTADTGYDPRFDDDYNITEVDIVSRWWKLYLRPTEVRVWDKTGLVPLEPAGSEHPLPEDQDGMSGAPVFFIHGLKQKEPRLGFAGIILRASDCGRVNMLKAATIRQAIRKHFDEL